MNGELTCPQGGPEEITNLEQLLDRLADASDDRERVSLGAIVETLGARAFGPLLLMAGLIVLSPLSGIPGLPTAIGLMVILIAIQLVLSTQWHT